jgi:hypothetical protein
MIQFIVIIFFEKLFERVFSLKEISKDKIVILMKVENQIFEFNEVKIKYVSNVFC